MTQCPHCTTVWPESTTSAQGGVQQCTMCRAPRCIDCSFINHPMVLPQLRGGGRQEDIPFCTMCGAPMLIQQQRTQPPIQQSNAAPRRPPPPPPPAAPSIPSLQRDSSGARPSSLAPAAASPGSPTAARRGAADPMASLVELTRRNCQSMGSIFVDCWDLSGVTTGGGGRPPKYVDGDLLQRYPFALAALPPMSATSSSTSLKHSGDHATLLPTRSHQSLSPQRVARVVDNELHALFDAVKHFFGRSPQTSTSPATGAPPAPHHPPQDERPYWHLIDPAIGVVSTDICQGAIGDCWFLSAVAVLAHRHADLISSLFINKDVNAEGVFGVRLCISGVWRCIIVGATFPTSNRGRYFAFARNRSNTALWVAVLEKAFAYAHGGYSNIWGGRPRDALMALTGMPCVFLRLGPEGRDPRTPISTRGFVGADGADVRGDSSFQGVEQQEALQFSKLSSYIDANCIVCASCGGTADTDATAASLHLETNHAYSLLACTTHPITNERVVALRNPWGHSKYAGMANPPQGAISRSGGASGGPVSGTDGVFWMTFTQFVLCFTEVDICLTRTYATSFQAVGLRVPGGGGGGGGGGWGQYTVAEDVVKRELMFSVLEGTEMHATVSQSFDERQAGDGNASSNRTYGGASVVPFTPEPSTSHRHNRKYVDVMLLVLRMVRQQAGNPTQAPRWVLHGAPARSSCDAYATHTFFCPPGDYCVVPMSVSGTSSTPPGTQPLQLPQLSLNVSVLSESSDVLPPPGQGAGAPPFPPLSHILYACCRASPSCNVKQLCGSSMLRAATSTSSRWRTWEGAVVVAMVGSASSFVGAWLSARLRR